MATLYKEIWLQELMTGFFGSDSFLSEVDDLSAYVDNNKIHWQEIGALPEVVKDNNTWPFKATESDEKALEVTLSTFDSKPTRIRHAHLVELSYDKRQAEILKHRTALQEAFVKEALTNYAPATHSPETPIINLWDTKIRPLKLEDIIHIQTLFDAMNAPTARRVAVLHPSHVAALAKQDLALYKSIFNGQGSSLFGFKVYVHTNTQRYVKPTNATPTAKHTGTGDASPSSLFFVGSEVMKAIGSVNMFSDFANPYERADAIGFQMRGIARVKRNKCVASIVG